MTGFQKFYFTQKELIDLVNFALENGNKILFLQKKLSGALDTYKEQKSKNVSLISSERVFRTAFDMKRRIINHKISANMRDTSPYLNLEEAVFNKNLLNGFRHKIYSESYSTNIIFPSRTYKDEMMKYLIRISANYFNYRMETWQKAALIKLLKDIFDSKVSKRLMTLINNSLNDRLVMVSALLPNKVNKDLFEKLYHYCKGENMECNLIFKDKFIKFLEDNFNLFNIPSYSLIVYKSPEERLDE
ncbi:hypothetical protein HOY82DRAFT_544409 [Tuber indicum]|nr:hypothetical protein HOY82DRAFT_544409 [Tuber indicum]